MSLDLRFFTKPFGFIFASFSAGILLGFFVTTSYLLLILSFVLIAIIGFLINSLFLRRDIITWLLYLFAFCLCGILLMQERLGVWNSHSIQTDYIEYDPCIVEVLEVKPTTSEWHSVLARVDYVYSEKEKIEIKEKVLLYVNDPVFSLKSGDVLLLSSKLTKIKNNGNPGEFDGENYWKRKGIFYASFVYAEDLKLLRHQPPSFLEKTLEGFRTYLNSALENSLSGDELSVAKALILGDKTALDQETKNSFSNTGAMHVLAVSGLHVGIIMQLLLTIFGWFPRFIKRNAAVIIVVSILWIYAFVTGLSPSVVRAVFMFSVLAISQLWGKQSNVLNSLFFSAFIAVLWNPFVLFDVGFQLSYLAILGILMFYKPIANVIYIENSFFRKIWEGTAIGFAAQLMTTPISLYYFHQFPNYFVLSNIGLMATSGLILALGIGLFTFSWFTFLSKFIGLFLLFTLFVTISFIEFIEGLPGAVAYGYELSFCTVILLTLITFSLFQRGLKRWHYGMLYSLGILVIGVMMIHRYQNISKNEVCFLNAKQFTLLIKKNDQVYCVYLAKEGSFNKVKRNVESYLKIHPGTVNYLPLFSRKWTLKSKDIVVSVEHQKDIIEVMVNKQNYTVLLSENEKAMSQNEMTIGMPWIEANCDFLLENGALRFRL